MVLGVDGSNEAGRMGAGFCCLHRSDIAGCMRVGKEQEGTSSNRPELAALEAAQRQVDETEDILYLCDNDSESVLTEVNGWIGEGLICCFYSVYFRAQVPVRSANLSGRICRTKDLATLRGYIDVITRTTFHLQDGIDVEVKVRNISPSNRKPSAAGSGYRTEDLGVGQPR